MMEHSVWWLSVKWSGQVITKRTKPYGLYYVILQAAVMKAIALSQFFLLLHFQMETYDMILKCKTKKKI